MARDDSTVGPRREPNRPRTRFQRLTALVATTTAIVLSGVGAVGEQRSTSRGVGQRALRRGATSGHVVHRASRCRSREDRIDRRLFGIGERPRSRLFARSFWLHRDHHPAWRPARLGDVDRDGLRSSRERGRAGTRRRHPRRQLHDGGAAVLRSAAFGTPAIRPAILGSATNRTAVVGPCTLGSASGRPIDVCRSDRPE